MPVLGEEGQPGTPGAGSIFPGVKEQLRLINIEPDFTFPESASKMPGQSPGELEQSLRIQPVIQDIDVGSLSLFTAFTL